MKRVPTTSNKSLQAWNAADEHIIQALVNVSHGFSPKILVINDRFGYLTKHSLHLDCTTVIHLKSQLDAIRINSKAQDNKLYLMDDDVSVKRTFDIVLLQLPKSLEFFEQLMLFVHQHLSEHGAVLGGFMTKHYSGGWEKVGARYFDAVSQSKAVKKSRVIKWSKPLAIPHITFKHQAHFNKGKMDQGTSLLLSALESESLAGQVACDLCSGTGHIAQYLGERGNFQSIDLIEDHLGSHLIAKDLLSETKYHHYWAYDFVELGSKTYDLIVSNPPFHFEFDIDFSISFHLLEEAYRRLREGGSLIVVGNNHINYGRLLEKISKNVKEIKKDSKFTVVKAMK